VPNTERRLQAQEAAHTSWDRTADRTGRTQPGRDGLSAKIIRDLIAEIGQDAWDAASPAQREEVAMAARSKHFSEMVRARHRRAADRRFNDQLASLRDAIAGRRRMT
jgi:hypothetical protein